MAARDREHRAPPPPATAAAAATPPPTAAPSVKVFSTQTITSVNSSTYKSLATDLSPESIKLFLQRFTERLKLAHPAVSVVLNTPAGDWEALVAARPDLADADAWISCTLSDCLQGGAYVKDFVLKRLADTEMGASGRRSLAYLAGRDEILTVYDLATARTRFDALPGFQMGMAKLEVANVAAVLVEAFSDLRVDNFRDPLSVHVMLLKKMPPSLAAQVDVIEHALFDRVSLGQGVVPITALVEMMATRLRAKAPARPVAAAASQAPGGRDTSRGGSRGDSSARKGVGDRVCYGCGEEGHASKDRPNKWKKCGLRDCTGNYNAKTCLLATSRAIPAVVLNAGGVPVPARIREKLVKKHAAKYPSASAADAEADSDDDILSDAGAGAIVSSGAWLGAGYDGPAEALALSHDAGAPFAIRARFAGRGVARAAPPAPIPARVLARPIFSRPSQA